MKFKVEKDITDFDLFLVVSKLEIITNGVLQVLFDIDEKESDFLIEELIDNFAIEQDGTLYKVIDKSRFIQTVLNMGYAQSHLSIAIFDR